MFSGPALSLFLSLPICSSGWHGLFFWLVWPLPVHHTDMTCTFSPPYGMTRSCSSDWHALHLSSGCLPEVEDAYFKG